MELSVWAKPFASTIQSQKRKIQHNRTCKLKSGGRKILQSVVDMWLVKKLFLVEFWDQRDLIFWVDEWHWSDVASVSVVVCSSHEFKLTTSWVASCHSSQLPHFHWWSQRHHGDAITTSGQQGHQTVTWNEIMRRKFQTQLSGGIYGTQVAIMSHNTLEVLVRGTQGGREFVNCCYQIKLISSLV